MLPEAADVKAQRESVAVSDRRADGKPRMFEPPIPKGMGGEFRRQRK